MWREGETETERTSKLEPAENAGGRGARKDRKGEGGGQQPRTLSYREKSIETGTSESD